MSHCHVDKIVDVPTGSRQIVLAGNPNVGKSVVFHELTGVYADVSNYPGTTVELFHGRFGDDVVIDTPGIYGVSSFNEEEVVARDVIIDADLIINVVDAVHLDRDLFLTLQLIDMGKPVVVALNMMDEVERAGQKINISRLKEMLGVPVIPIVAVEKRGLAELKNSLSQAAQGIPTELGIPQAAAASETELSRAAQLLILEGDEDVAARYRQQPASYRDHIYGKRRERVNAIIDDAVEDTQSRAGSQLLSRLMVKPLTGIPLLGLTLFLMYQVVGVFIAGNVVDLLEGTVMGEYYEPLMRSLIGRFAAENSVIYEILAGEFGILTMTITYLVGLLLPLVMGFYLFLSILEDSGYMPRIATLVDRVLTKFGLNGRAVIPMILGLGCVTMATITTRILGSRRERIIATMLLALAIPCSAQLGVITGMLGAVGGWYFALYILVIFVTLVVIGTVLNRLLPGQSTDLLIDLPTLRLPRPVNVLRKTVNKTKMFVFEAGPLFFLGALIISVMKVTGLLEAVQSFLYPLTVGWLELPRQASTAFIMGIVRRDFGAAGLYDMALTPEQTLVSLITITLFVPCIASMIVVFKERNWKEGLAILVSCFAIAFTVGGLVAKIL